MALSTITFIVGRKSVSITVNLVKEADTAIKSTYTTGLMEAE